MQVLSAVALVVAPARARASDLAITAVMLAPASGESTDKAATVRARITVEWKNGWRNERNHDAAWIFLKLRAGSNLWQHGTLAPGTAPRIEGTPRAAVRVPADRVGFFAAAGEAHRGPVRWAVEVTLNAPDRLPKDAKTQIDVRAFGVEVVQIPEGPFTLGDPDPEALKFASFYRADASGAPAGLFRVTSEDPLPIGPRAGALHYRSGNPSYGGDGQGPVPGAFPKGFRSFYVMKYELLQGQYVDFLNLLLNEAGAGFRAVHAAPDYTAHRGTIRFQDGGYVAERPQRPANFVSWSDAIAWADWAGLRPMTDLEYTKAARGPSEPVAREFPWGSADKSELKRVLQPDGELATGGEADESLLSDTTRGVLGASYYWVMDLAGSLWERVVTIGHPAGRAFTGSHGDGKVTGFGSATNEDWPKGDEAPGGYGYRGGGYYEKPGPPTPFLPHSPIAYRPFGSWGQGPRSVAYGFRAVRTAPATEAVAR